MAHLPWMKFDKARWLQNPSLRLCKRATRSFWLDMKCLMHDAEPFGHLVHNEQPLTAKGLALVLGDREREVVGFLKELEAAGVFRRTPEGVIYCPEMLREKERAEAGSISAQRRWKPSNPPSNPAPAERPPIGKPIGSGNGPPKAVPAAQRDTRQTRDSYTHIQDSDAQERPQTPDTADTADTVSDSTHRESGEGAGADSAAQAPLPGDPAQQAQPEPEKRRKRPERADQELVQHMSEHGQIDAGAAWLLVMAARDATSPDHKAASERCEEYSRQFRLGWFADEKQSAVPPLDRRQRYAAVRA